MKNSFITTVVALKEARTKQNKVYYKVTLLNEEGKLTIYHLFGPPPTLHTLYRATITHSNGFDNLVLSLPPSDKVPLNTKQLAALPRIQPTLPTHPQITPDLFITRYNTIVSLYISPTPSMFLHTDSLTNLSTALLSLFQTAAPFPAALNNHHTQEGGLLTHTYQVLLLFNTLISASPFKHTASQNDILEGILASVLHDMGKMQDYTPCPNPTWNPDSIIPHPFTSATFARTFLTPFLQPDSVTRIQSIILSHHGQPQWQSLTYPKTLIAQLVHYADMLSLLSWESRLSDNPRYLFSKI